MGVFFSWHGSVGTDVLITSHHASPKYFAPPRCPCQSPSPSFAVSICSLALGLEQRAIWARIPASSGGPLHRKDSFSSTSVWQHQTHFCFPPPPQPLHLFLSSTSSPPLPLLLATKTSHTLDRNYAKCSTLLPLHVSPPQSLLSSSLHPQGVMRSPRMLCFLFGAFLDNCFPVCIIREMVLSLFLHLYSHFLSFLLGFAFWV